MEGEMSLRGWLEKRMEARLGAMERDRESYCESYRRPCPACGKLVRVVYGTLSQGYAVHSCELYCENSQCVLFGKRVGTHAGWTHEAISEGIRAGRSVPDTGWY